jgi:hypothetical protein
MVEKLSRPVVPRLVEAIQNEFLYVFDFAVVAGEIGEMFPDVG